MSYYTKSFSRFDEVAIKTGKAHMLLPDRDLKLLIELIETLVPKGQRGLEIGTFIGKTTAALVACGYPMVTVEHNQDYLIQATNLFDKFGIREQVTMLNGSAEHILTQQNDYFWDSIRFVFVDANKGGYYKYFKFLTSPKGIKQGYFIFDNVFLNNQIRDQVCSLFDCNKRNRLGIETRFGVDVSSMKELLSELGDHKKYGPSWSVSVKDQMLKLCIEARDQYNAVLLETSDGMLLFSNH